jgi:hypothetical protein
LIGDSYDIATQFNRHAVAAARISRRRLEKVSYQVRYLIKKCMNT